MTQEEKFYEKLWNFSMIKQSFELLTVGMFWNKKKQNKVGEINEVQSLHVIIKLKCWILNEGR